MIRKIATKHDEEKKRKRNQIIVGLVLVFVMLFSVIGYSFRSNSNSNTAQILKYNNYEFTNVGGYWTLDIGGTVFSFASKPSNAYKINSSLNSITNYYGKELYLYSENAGAESEVYQNMHLVASQVLPACPADEEACDKNLPIKNCSDNFIIIKEKEEIGVFQQDGCVFIEGNAENMIKITDGFLLKILGVQ